MMLGVDQYFINHKILVFIVVVVGIRFILVVPIISCITTIINICLNLIKLLVYSILLVLLNLLLTRQILTKEKLSEVLLTHKGLSCPKRGPNKCGSLKILLINYSSDCRVTRKIHLSWIVDVQDT